jgi:hypothetical protein
VIARSIIIIITTLLLVVFTAEASSLKIQLQHCSIINDNNERLACYDQLTPKQAALVTTPSAEAIAPLAGVVKAESPDKVDNFGKKHLKKEVIKADQSIIFTIATLKKLNYDNWKFTFENGQVWRQKDSKKIKLKSGDRVKLSKGFMGAIYLQKIDSNKRITVKRIK